MADTRDLQISMHKQQIRELISSMGVDLTTVPEDAEVMYDGNGFIHIETYVFSHGEVLLDTFGRPQRSVVVKRITVE